MAKPRNPQQNHPSTTAQSPTGDTRPDHSIEDFSRVALPTDETDERTTDEAQIRARAYELYIERGVAQGDELGDWLRAEREVRSQSTSTGTEADRSPPAV